MFKLLRRLIAAAFAVILLLVIALFAAFWYADSIAKRAVEKGGTYALGVDTTVRSINVGLLKGTVKLDGLRIANPQGFTASPTFLTLEDGTTSVALNSLRSDVIRIPTLRLEDCDVALQRTADGKTNYQAIIDNLEKLGSGERPRAPDDKAAQKRLIIGELVIRDVTVVADVAPAGESILGQAAAQLGRVTIPIDEIRLTDVGQTGEGVAGSGVTPGELAGIIIEAVLAAAVEKGGNLLPPDFAADLKTNLAKLGNLEKLAEDLKSAKSPEDVKKVLDQTAEEARKIQEGLKNVLPGRK